MSVEVAEFICVECIRERGYFWPKDGGVEARKCNCSMCEEFTICFLIDDLEPLMEIQNGLPKGKVK